MEKLSLDTLHDPIMEYASYTSIHPRSMTVEHRCDGCGLLVKFPVEWNEQDKCFYPVMKEEDEGFGLKINYDFRGEESMVSRHWLCGMCSGVKDVFYKVEMIRLLENGMDVIEKERREEYQEWKKRKGKR